GTVPTYRGGQVLVPLDAALSDRVRELSRSCGATPFMTMLGAWSVCLAANASCAQVVVGTPLSNRNRVELEGLVGLVTNTLALKLDLRGDPSFFDLLGRVREVCLGAFSHEEVPFERVVEELAPPRELGRSPIFQVMFTEQREGATNLRLPGLEVSQVGLERRTAKFELTLHMQQSGDGYVGGLEYDADLFDESTARRWSEQFVEVLSQVCARPDRSIREVQLLSGEERRRVLDEWNATERPPTDPLVVDAVDRIAEKWPAREALRDPQGAMTYEELREQSNRVARILLEQGVGPEDRVGVMVERSCELVVTLLAVGKAGAAYVALDGMLPEARLRAMVEDAAVGLVFCGTKQEAERWRGIGVRAIDWESCRARLQEMPAGRPEGELRDNGLAYVLFASGTTGRPKGVMVEHGALRNFNESMRREPGMTPEDVIVSVTTISFDIAGLELWLPLTTGARVILATREQAADGRELASLLESGRATMLQGTPTTFRLLCGASALTPGLRALCGGEALEAGLGRELVHGGLELWNMYGPTETTVWSCVHPVTTAERTIPIGRPIANTYVYLLDERLDPVPLGSVGELCLGGAGVARGYTGLPDHTAERFVPDPWHAGRRLYRTGDRARYRADGALQYVGRADGQIKLRGHRIELGEVESALMNQPDVEQAAAAVRARADGEKELVPYLVMIPEPGGSED